MAQDTAETEPRSNGNLSHDAAGDPSSTGVMTAVGPVITVAGAETDNPGEPAEPGSGTVEASADASEAAAEEAARLAPGTEEAPVGQEPAAAATQAVQTAVVAETPAAAPPASTEPVYDELSAWQPSAGSSSSPKTEAAESETRPSARREREDGPEPAAALTADRLLAGRETPPVSGWRRLLYSASLGYINVGDSDKVRLRRAQEHRIAMRLGQRTRYVPVLSRKGGVGKTTVTTLLGMALADLREDRVIAMDANPDRGTLSDRSPGRADFTARQLVKNRFDVNTFSELAAYVARDGSRLDVLASDTDPAVAQAFDDADYRAVTEILSRYYSIVLTDSGTGMVHSVMKGTLEKADSVVLVSGGSVDEARLASETLSWLEAHGRQDLVARAIVVVNMSAGEGTLVNIEEIEDHFRSRVKSVLRLPYDRHLAEGSRVSLDQLKPATRAAVIELAALVVDELQGL